VKIQIPQSLDSFFGLVVKLHLWFSGRVLGDFYLTKRK